MALFFRRFIGALVLDAGAFEDIESDRHAAMQSVIVVLLACLAGGVAAMGLGLVGVGGFVTGATLILGAWLIWVSVIATVGTVVLPEPQTRSNVQELLRTLGFAAAPAVFLVFAAMRAVAPLIIVMVAIWMVAAAVRGVRQALDYRSTMRAAAVCAIALLVSFGVMFAVSMVFTRQVN